jgi:hypothetical protein
VPCDVETGLVYAFHDADFYPKHGSLADGLKVLAEADVLIGHNITGYDLPLLNRLHPEYAIGSKIIIDTQRLAELIHPEIKKQSIENWIALLKLEDPKTQISDWSVLTEKILTRCVGDVKNNLALFKYLKHKKKTEEDEGNSFNNALDLEQKVALLHAQQVMHGVYYNVRLAQETAERFTNRMAELQERVASEAPPIMTIPSLSAEGQEVIQQCAKDLSNFDKHLPGASPFKNLKWTVGTVVNPFTKKMEYTSATKSYFGDYYPKVQGEYCKVTFDLEDLYTQAAISWFGEEYIWKVKGTYNKVQFAPLNLSSDNQVKDYLLDLGWVPIEYNYSKKTKERTSPKLTEESFVSLPPGLGQDIAEYRVLQHRRNLIITSGGDGGALNLVRPDGRVEADAFTCGTPTSRYRHKGAICNIPRPTSKYGDKIRELYCVPPGHLMIGVDLSGIEARMLTHFAYRYEGGPEFAELVLNGDWHSANAELWGCSRNDAKTHLYALLYSAGATKLGAILGKDARVGKRNKDRFMKRYACYHMLVKTLEDELKSNGGYIYGLDGRRFYVRAAKDVLNTCLQGNSAILFKSWMIQCEYERRSFVRERNVQLHQILAYHDELGYELYSDDPILAKEWGDITIDTARKAGESFNLNVPIAAEAKFGLSWRDTH